MRSIKIPDYKSIILLILFTLNSSHADTIGGEVSIGAFNHSPSGQASYTLPFTSIGTFADLEDTLGFSEQQDLFAKVYIEHPFLLIPNIRLGYTTLGHDGSNSVELFSWGDIVNFTGEIDNSLSLDTSDITLYYELLDNWVEVDMGLTVRYITGNIDVTTDISNNAVDFSTWIPMLYGKARFIFPTTDLSLQVEGNAVSYGSLTSYDYELSARYTLAMGIGIEAGYKVFHLDSNELLDGLNADLTFSGPYAAAIWDF